MNAILAIPMPVRLAMLFAVGMGAGAAANVCAGRLAGRGQPGGSRLRPILLTLLGGTGMAALYWWEIGCQGLLPATAPAPAPSTVQTVLHGQYAAHVVLVWLMLVASLIDIQQKIIPDAVTVPGTLVGLFLAAAFPWMLLPDLPTPIIGVIPPPLWWVFSVRTCPFMQPASPCSWPLGFGGFPLAGSLLIGLGCWWAWCVALMPRSWYTRHGWARAWALMCARLRRERATYRALAMGLIGSVAIAAVWGVGGRPWQSLLSGLVGMAAAGGLVWTVRILASAALQREAMGFGDVTLMAMIGTFLGWQSCLFIFFLAPVAGLLVGAMQVILFRDSEIPYGPFLCLATVAVIVQWTAIWDWGAGAFAVGWLVPLVMVFCMILMSVLLGLWRTVLGLFR